MVMLLPPRASASMHIITVAVLLGLFPVQTELRDQGDQVQGSEISFEGGFPVGLGGRMSFLSKGRFALRFVSDRSQKAEPDELKFPDTLVLVPDTLAMHA